MLKSAFYCIIILLFVACGQQEHETIVDMKDITPQAERNYEDHKKDSVDLVDYSFNTKIADEVGIQVMEIDILEESMFPDRFEPISQYKLQLQLKEDQILFYQWSFKDSIKTLNAFYNWIDCFGANCKSIKLGQKVNFQKDNFVILINDTSLIYISSPLRLKKEDWLYYFEKNSKIKDWKIIIHQAPRAKANWFNVMDGKKQEFKTTI